MAPLHSLGHNNKNEVKHDFFSYLMPLDTSTAVPCDATCIINGASVWFMKWRDWNKVWHYMFWTCDAAGTKYQHHMKLIVLSVVQFFLLGQDDWNNVQLAFLVMVTWYQCWYCKKNWWTASSIGTIPYVRKTWSKWDATWLFQSFDILFDTCIRIMWYQWHCQ